MKRAWALGLVAVLGGLALAARRPREDARLEAALHVALGDDISAERAELEDPSHHALDALRAALLRTTQGGRARITVYGGSHTAADLYTRELRRAFQRGFGDLGHGFVFPVPPFEDYWQSGVRIEPSDGFSCNEPDFKHMTVERYGIAGMAFDAEGVAYADFATDGVDAERMSLYFLAQPAGGAVQVRIDDTAFQVHTAASEVRAASADFAFPLGAHRVSLETDGRPVRLFGASLEREGSGILVDQMGLAGSKARHPLLWDEDTWGDLITARRPDLVILSYGNNETDDHHLAGPDHVRHLDLLLERVARHLPNASCIVVGPTDRLLPDATGALSTPALIPYLAREHRRVAFAHGCAYFDTLAWQGGPGTQATWQRSTPPLARDDGIHLTEVGYQRFGRALAASILRALAARS